MANFVGQTTRDFCTAALGLISVISKENPNPTAAQLNGALYTLNEISDSWNVDGDMIYSQQYTAFNLSGKGTRDSYGLTTYTIGPVTGNTTPDFVIATRPVNLSFAAFRLTNSNPVIDIPIKILTAEEYAAERVKGVTTTISIYMYMDEQWPIANLYLWPVPVSGGALVLTSWQLLNTSLTLDTTFSMPPAYARGLRYDLAVALAPEYGIAGTPAVQQLASTLGIIKRQIGWQNLRPNDLEYSADAQGTIGGMGGTYNIYTDEVQ
ncbi:MAG: hypothetical protein ACREQ5_06685 [Candidatus Dormibacteria bacterium]